MKKFTIIFSVCLVLGLTLMLGVVMAVPDFVPPDDKERDQLQPENPIWDKTLDDLIEYLDGEGVFGSDECYLLIEGIASDARIYDDVELYWWDLDHLTEDDVEWANYRSAVENGYADIKGIGELQLDVHGPFAIGYHAYYTGDPDALMDAFYAYCVEFEDDIE